MSTDLEAVQETLHVPHAVLHPTTSVRATLASGLYDAATGGWLMPGMTATATQPGGAGVADLTPSGIFNLGFRTAEPILTMNTPPDTAQADALAAHDPTTFQHPLDFAALYAKKNSTTVPATGLQIRFYPSAIDLGGGFDAAFPQERGRLQPYSLYIPTSGAQSHPHPFLLSIHSNGQHYWQYDGTGIMSDLGEAHDTVVLSPLGRGHDGWYIDSSEDDVFEAWADVARHVSLDPDRTAISGYSMGGYATYRLGGLYPDLFAKAFSVVGPPGKLIWIPGMPPTGGEQTLTNLWLENNRNLPYLNYNQVSDELVPEPGPQTQNIGTPGIGTTSFEQLGYRFRWRLFEGGEHYTLAALGYHFPGAAEFLADTGVDRDPAHVTYAHVPGSDNADLGLVHDHAYWVSDVTVASVDAGPGAKGVIDARSHGFGLADPVSTAELPTPGVESLPFVEQGRTWAAPAAEAVANSVDVTTTNLARSTLQLDRAKLSGLQTLTVTATSDVATALTLAGTFGPGTTATMDGAGMPSATVTADRVVLPLATGAHVYVLTPGSGPVGTGPVGTGSPGTGSLDQAVPAAPHSLASTGLGTLVPLAGLGLLTAGAVVVRRRRHHPGGICVSTREA